MTTRERVRAVLARERADRMPMIEWATWWDKTLDAWKAQGLRVAPVEGLSEGQATQLHFGLDLHLQTWVGFRTDKTPAPAYHGAPIVETIEDYERIKPTLYPKDPIDEAQLRVHAERQRRGDAAVWLTLDGAFWGPRTLLGIQNHLLAFYDAPELMHAINRDIAAFNLRVIERVCEIVTPDFMTFGEDMSYNNGPMISEAMFDAFLLPYYRMVVPELKARGIRVLVDSDGDIEKALPWFLRAGVEGILPLERQAGVDVSRLQRAYPEALFVGHYDKMVMPRGEEAMRAEFDRLLPAMRNGGFIASVDHQTPPGVSLRNYEIYVNLLKEYAQRAYK